jgi:hypothetical protein
MAPPIIKAAPTRFPKKILTVEVSISFANSHGAKVAAAWAMTKKNAIAMARIYNGKISLTVRYAELAPAEAKKKMIDHANV